MSSAHFTPLVLKPIVIAEPGVYVTRCGEPVIVRAVSRRHNFGCVGHYLNGVAERWHKSGRIFAGTETANDIVRQV